MHFRKFKAKDAAFCFKIRSHAFIQKFYGELGLEAVAAGVNAYLPDDYIQMGKKINHENTELDRKRKRTLQKGGLSGCKGTVQYYRLFRNL
jgi:hypothetical protein